MTAILITVHELREREDISDVPEEQLGIAPDLSVAEGQQGVQDQQELRGWEAIAERPPELSIERTSKGDHVGQGAYDIVRLGGSSGERWCPGRMRVVFTSSSRGGNLRGQTRWERSRSYG